ncbi:MAG: hypothetical protein IJF59_06010, partial [Clostridia bacterium]|nr:hypothetical protein [Clostridia bacterium]
MMTLFEWMLSSSALILAVALLRLGFKGRMGLRLQYALWLPVLLRLLLPFSFGETAMSLGNLLPEEPGATTVVGVTVLETARETALILPDATDGGTPLSPPDTTPQDPAPQLPQTSHNHAEAAVSG